MPVQRKISRVKTGALSNTAAYLSTVALTLTNGDMATIAGKGYITFKMYSNVSGFFWSGDPMATASTDDYSMLARGRVVDKAQRLTYAVLVQEVDDDIPVNANGTIDTGYAKWLQTQVENAIQTNMVAQGNAQGVTCFIDGTQNVLATSTLNVAVTVTPEGYATTINVLLNL